MNHSSKSGASVAEPTKQADSSERARASKRIVAQRSRHSAAQRVQIDTSYASDAGSNIARQIPCAKISRVQLKQLAELQSVGYERAGKLARVKQCGTIPIVSNKVALGITQAGGVTVSGRYMCGSRWCADCWGRIANARSEDVKLVSQWAQDSGYTLVLATFTAAHFTTETLEKCDGNVRQAVIKQHIGEVFDGLSNAWRYMHSGRKGKELKDGRVGYVRGFELTTDKLGEQDLTGTHGHYHVLLIFESGADLDKHKSLMWERWQQGCFRQGLKTSARGFDWKILKVDSNRHINAAASYLVKGEKLSAEKIGGEIAEGNKKSGHGTKRTSPEGLLRAIGALKDDQAQRLGARAVAQWRGIEEACKGRRWLTWSRDLRKKAGLGEEKTDEEIANTQEETQGDCIAVVEYDQVKDHIDEIREVILETKKTEEKWPTLLLCLDTLGISYEVILREEWDMQIRKWIKARNFRE